MAKQKTITNNDLEREIRRLNKQLERISKVGAFSFAGRPGRFVSLQFGVGVIRGVGSALGATVVLAILIGVLRNFPLTQSLIEFIESNL